MNDDDHYQIISDTLDKYYPTDVDEYQEMEEVWAKEHADDRANELRSKFHLVLDND